MDEKKGSGPDLLPRWRELVRRLWEPDGKSIVGFLPEIVAMIKSTKSRAVAERALLNVLHSPKVRDMPLRLKRLAVVHPGYQAMKDLADATGTSFGNDRADAIAKINTVSKDVALTTHEIVDKLDAITKDKLDTASADARRARRRAKDAITKEKLDGASAEVRRARRARAKLGISRKKGRPKKTDTDSP